MAQRADPDPIEELVKAHFSDCTVINKGSSPNGKHFLLQKDSVTKHLKVVKKSYIEANDYSEVALLRSIHSEHVVKLEDFGDIDDEHSFLVFPHINGQTLDKMRKENGWKEEDLKKLCADVLKGFVDLADAGVVHRDIKPKNIIYDNVNQKYVILDLGIGYFIEGPNKDNTKVPRGIGPKYYSAPEQFKIAIDEPYSVTQATDQFSFGEVLYELATNDHPFIERSPTEPQSYATLVMDDALPNAITRTTDLPDGICNVIEKMLAKEPSERFLTLDAAGKALGFTGVPEVAQTPALYLKMPHQDKDEFIQFVQDHLDHVSGVVLSSSDSAEYANKLDELNIPILFDPKTYKLQINDSTEQLASKLNIPYSSAYSILSLYKLKEKLMDGAYQLSKTMLSGKVILPYFNVEGVGTDYLRLTKEIWFEARHYYGSKGLDEGNIYGALIVPYSVVRSRGERAKLMSQLSANYPLDGLLVTYENADKAISTTVDEEYLKGLKQMTEFFEATFKDVIIYQTDLSVLPFMAKASFSVGWSKKSRHFNFSAGGNSRNRTYKMKYYASKLFTFIEEKSKIQTIVLMGKSSYLECNCPDCTANNPLDSGYRENEAHEKRHFFHALAVLNSQISGLKPSERRQFFKTYLQGCEDAGVDVKSTGVIGNETIPSYESLISLIDS